MSKSVKYLLVSLPTSISTSNDYEEALTALRTTVSNDYGTVYPFRIPEFKIGTLDALVQQADELAKLSSACEGVVKKVADSLGNILDGDESKTSQQKTVSDSERLSSTRYPETMSNKPLNRTGRSILKEFFVE
jgi:V-type H+-transporting ATPase subunit C